MSLTLALILDAVFGEPQAIWSRAPHPAVLMGRALSWADTRLNRGRSRRLKGVVVIGALNMAMVAIGLALAALPGPVAEILVAAVLLAQNSLAAHVRAVAEAMDDGIEAARDAVARVVGRDTAGLDEAAVARAAIESAAENFSDGVVAPAFWFALFGLPGILVYKLTNTADSMIGYRSEKHAEFGWAAARLDDLLNWVPARLSAVFIMLAASKPGAWAFIRRDAPLHRSPNAGWPEAAMAVALNAGLSGPRTYDGETRDYPWVYPEGRRRIGAQAIGAAVRILWRSWALLLTLSLPLWLV